jgi:lysophospholipase L1-like esterase
MKGATSQQTLNEVMPLLKNLKPEFITLLIGANDWIKEGISNSKFKIRIKNLIDEIQSNLPPKKLLLITIPDFSCSPKKIGAMVKALLMELLD